MGCDLSHCRQSNSVCEKQIKDAVVDESCSLPKTSEETANNENNEKLNRTSSNLNDNGNVETNIRIIDHDVTKSVVNDRYNLTAEQISIIENTWKLLVENISRVGVITFIGLFETHPDVQQVFLPLRTILPEDLKYSKELRAHALRVMGYIQKVVARLNEPSKCEQLLMDLGKRHVTYGAKVEYIDLVGQQFIYAIKPSLESVWSEAVEDAWNQLFKYINQRIKERMVKELETQSSDAN